MHSFNEKFPLTYYKQTETDFTRIKFQTPKMICSTIDDGTISFPLVPLKKLDVIEVSRSRNQESVGFSPSPTTNFIILKNFGETFDETRNDLFGIIKEAHKLYLKSEFIKNEQKEEMIKKIDNDEVYFFFKHCINHNLMVPYDDKFNGQADLFYYLIDINLKQVFWIEKKET